jgi:ATP adenylyltransferase
MIERSHLFAPNKLDYIRGKRPDVACILCAIRENHPDVANLEIYRNALFFVSLNLYPYNPGHLMIVPQRHIEFPDELTDEEALALHHLQKKCLGLIRQLYPAKGFNIGYNLGELGGGSIAHLHLHLVPRFRNEHGFMTTLAQTHIMVESPQEMLARFQKALAQEPLS